MKTSDKFGCALLVGLALLVFLYGFDGVDAQHPAHTPGWHSTHSTATSGDVAIKTSAGVLHTVTVDTVATTAGNVVLKNSADGTGTDTIVNIYIDDAATFQPFTLILDAEFDTGLYADWDGTAAGTSISVSYW